MGRDRVRPVCDIPTARKTSGNSSKYKPQATDKVDINAQGLYSALYNIDSQINNMQSAAQGLGQIDFSRVPNVSGVDLGEKARCLSSAFGTNGSNSVLSNVYNNLYNQVDKLNNLNSDLYQFSAEEFLEACDAYKESIANSSEEEAFGSALDSTPSEPTQEELDGWYKSALEKDPNEWTDEEKYAVSEYYDDLMGRYNDAKTDAEAHVGDAVDDLSKYYYDQDYGNKYNALAKEKKELESKMKANGMMDYTTGEKAWQDFKRAGQELAQEYKEVGEAFKEDGFVSGMQELGDAAKKTAATGTVVAGAVVCGVARVVEAAVDAGNIVKTAVVDTPVAAAIDLVTGGDNVKQLWDDTMDQVSRNMVEEGKEAVYNTGLGKAINDTSTLKYDGDAATATQDFTEEATKKALYATAAIVSGPVLPAVLGAAEHLGSSAEKVWGEKDEEGNYTGRNALGTAKIALDTIGGAAEGYAAGQVGSAIYNGINMLGQVGVDGVFQAINGVGTTGTRNYLAHNAGKLAAHAAKQTFTDVDTYADIAANVVDYATTGVSTGEWNKKQLAADVGFSLVGNYFGNLAGGIFDAANPSSKSMTPLDSGVPKANQTDELFEGNLDNIRGGQTPSRTPNLDKPVTSSTPKASQTDELFESDLDNIRGGQTPSRIAEPDRPVTSSTPKANQTDELFDSSSNEIAATAPSIKYSKATDQSVNDVEYAIQQFMDRYGETREYAMERVEKLIATGNYNYMTSFRNARQILKQYDLDEISDSLNIIKNADKLSQRTVNDVEYAIQQFMDRYGETREYAIERVEKLIATGNYNYMTSFGDARQILKQYDLDEIDAALRKIKDNKDLPFSSTPKVSPQVTPTPNELFEANAKKYNSAYGVDQGAIYDLCTYTDANGKTYTYRQAKRMVNNAIANHEPIPKFIKEGGDQYFDIKNSLCDKYGLTKKEASIFLSAIDDKGACTYAAVCNEIFDSFNGNESLFEQKFGFPMYTKVDGVIKPNYEQLLTDIYFDVNKVENGGKLIIKNADGTYSLNPKAYGSKVDPLGRRMIDVGGKQKQQYLSYSTGNSQETIENYLKRKGLEGYDTDLIIPYDNKIQARDIPDIVSEVKNGMKDGYQYNLGIFYGSDEIKFVPLDNKGIAQSTFDWDEGDGHAVYVTDVNAQGFIVSSWGSKYLIPFEDLTKSGAPWTMNKSFIKK